MSESLPADPLSELRLPPHSTEAEQAVLGALLLDNSAWEKVADLIMAQDFYRHEHRLIWLAIVRLLDASRPADALTVSERLQAQNELELIGGLSYLVTLTQNTPSSANIKRYAEIVREQSVMRQLVSVGNEIVESAFNPQGREAAQLLDEAESKVFQIAESSARTQQGFLEMPDILTEVTTRIDHLYSRDNPDAVTGIPTGFIDIDEKTSGLQPGDLIIVAGRPSMGKTAFAMNLAENVAIQTALPVAVFSMEMPATQLATRMIGSVGRLDQHKLRTGRFDDEDWQKFTHALGVLADAKIFIDETPSLSALELRARSRRLARRFDGKLGLIVVDYLQLMSGSSQGARQQQNRTAEISEISRAMKGLARELSVPVIALSQLNRSVEQRPNKRPMMSDLRESGAIEQDADLIMFMYRDEYYNPDSPDKGLAEVIIGKHRNGPTGIVRLAFRGMYSRFENAVLDPNRSWDSHE